MFCPDLLSLEYESPRCCVLNLSDKFQCVVKADPHLSGYASATANLNFPCKYRLTRVQTALEGGTPGLAFCAFEVFGFNEIIHGRYFTSGMEISLAIGDFANQIFQQQDFIKFDVNEEGVESSDGGATIWGNGVHNTWNNITVECRFDNFQGFAILAIPRCNFMVKFRPFNPEEPKGPQSKVPAISVVTGQDTVFGETEKGRYPSSLCGETERQGEDPNLYINRAKQLDLKNQHQKTVDDFHSCPEDLKPRVVHICGSILNNKKITKCMGIQALRAFRGCLIAVCSNKLLGCGIYKDVLESTGCTGSRKVKKLYSEPCSFNLCENDGTCIDEGDGQFSCQCPYGFQGKLCDELACVDVKDTCERLAMNGDCTIYAESMQRDCRKSCHICGVCFTIECPVNHVCTEHSATEDGYTCHCPEGTTGQYCNAKPCTEKGEFCVEGAVCTSDQRCQCQFNKTGDGRIFCANKDNSVCILRDKPHLRSFGGAKANLKFPCRYRLTRLVTGLHNESEGGSNTICSIEVFGFSLVSESGNYYPAAAECGDFRLLFRSYDQEEEEGRHRAQTRPPAIVIATSAGNFGGSFGHTELQRFPESLCGEGGKDGDDDQLYVKAAETLGLENADEEAVQLFNTCGNQTEKAAAIKACHGLLCKKNLLVCLGSLALEAFNSCMDVFCNKHIKSCKTIREDFRDARPLSRKRCRFPAFLRRLCTNLEN
ncbi:hypothetical protein ACOMHN_050512 [Nucella lapillus]